jgi:hypothetical protein
LAGPGSPRLCDIYNMSGNNNMRSELSRALTAANESDSPTSSSENESEATAESSTSAVRNSLHSQSLDPTAAQPLGDISDDSDSSSPSPDRGKWAEYDAPVLPHRVLKLRRLVFEALHSALTILHETRPRPVALVKAASSGRPKEKGRAETVKLDVREPWMRLSRTVGALKAAVSGSKEGDEQSEKCLGEFVVEDERPRLLTTGAALKVVIQHEIIPFTEDKAYVRKLAKNEAKAIPSLLKAWAKVYQPGADTSDDERPTEAMQGYDVVIAAAEAAPIIILRLAHHTLLATPRDPLDLSSLAMRSSELDSLDIPALCDTLNVVVGDITRLDMSQNGWRREDFKLST